MGSRNGWWPEDEVDVCDGCQEGPMYWNDKTLYHFDGYLFCEDCLMKRIYSDEAGINWVIDERLEDYCKTDADKRYLLDLLSANPEYAADGIEDYCRDNIEDFASWMNDKHKIFSLEELRNMLVTILRRKTNEAV